jgi:3-hydroxyisobutyrate dehydrogenase-like beta-hydroxyacid dehydrogenase
VLSVCPPSAAVDVAADVAATGFRGVYVDANAIAPRTSLGIGEDLRAQNVAFVDAAIIGAPSDGRTGPRLYLCGERGGTIADLFAGTPVSAVVLTGEAGSASALKVAFAAWTKAGAALLLTAREAARRAGVEEALVEEWRAIPGLLDRLSGSEAQAAAKGWRWVGEMEEASVAFADLGLPPGFHQAAAATFAVERER